MNSLKTIMICLTTLVSLNLAYSQHQLGVMSSLQYGNMLDNDNQGFFDSNISLGIGLVGRKQFKSKLYMTGALSFQELGYFISLQEVPDAYSYYWKAKAVNLYTDLGYSIIETEKIIYGTSLGLTVGFALDQEQEFIQHDDSMIIDYHRRDDLVMSININQDLIYKASDRVTINLRPNWKYILHSGAAKIKERNIGADFILLYRITSLAKKEVSPEEEDLEPAKELSFAKPGKNAYHRNP